MNIIGVLMSKLQIQRVDFEDDITYECFYDDKKFHVVFRESEHIDQGLNVKTESYKYVNAVNNYDQLKQENEVLKSKLKDIYDAALKADIDESHLANVIEQAYLELNKEGV